MISPRARSSTSSSIGGIEVRTGVALGKDVSLAELRKKYDAVFLGFGLAGVNGLGLDGEQLEGVANAVDYIATLRQAPDKASLPVGRRVVVIGGGMTAIDIAVQSKALGARGSDHGLPPRPGAHERQPLRAGVRADARRDAPALVEAAQAARELDGRVCGVEFESTQVGRAKPASLEADMVFKAIGQKVLWDRLADTAQIRRAEAGPDRGRRGTRTSLPGVWAGGDCVAGGEDLTVSAVQDGKLAAISIDKFSERGK